MDAVKLGHTFPVGTHFVKECEFGRVDVCRCFRHEGCFNYEDWNEYIECLHSKWYPVIVNDAQNWRLIYWPSIYDRRTGHDVLYHRGSSLPYGTHCSHNTQSPCVGSLSDLSFLTTNIITFQLRKQKQRQQQYQGSERHLMETMLINVKPICNPCKLMMHEALHRLCSRCEVPMGRHYFNNHPFEGSLMW